MRTASLGHRLHRLLRRVAPRRATRREPRPHAQYPGDFIGRSTVLYDPIEDDRPDPGEIVWTRVVFEEDYRLGKDRPVLVVGRDDPWVLALMLTSKDHNHDARDAAAEARHGRVWFDLGTGDWDPRHRPSEVRIDRVLRLDPAQVRREGATLDRARFDQVAARLRSVNGWR